MSFIAVLLALLIEQARPLSRHNPVHTALRRWARQCALHLDTGQRTHAVLAWCAAVGGPAALVAAIYHVLWAWPGWIGGAVWSVAVLYATLGFRQFSHHFTAIRDALDAGDETRARVELAQWQQVQVAHLPRSELVRHVIETSVLAAHRHVFGVLLCYGVGAALGLGPAGAVLYRMAEYVPRGWGASHRLDTRARGVPGAAPVSARPAMATPAQTRLRLNLTPSERPLTVRSAHRPMR
jgi:adenosylcobinamide-phosphate synthase